MQFIHPLDDHILTRDFYYLSGSYVGGQHGRVAGQPPAVRIRGAHVAVEDETMNHTHEYRFWHAHTHGHAYRKLPPGAFEGHATGHYHFWAQTHDHGAKSNSAPHTHQAKQAHPGEECRHHHAVGNHGEAMA